MPKTTEQGFCINPSSKGQFYTITRTVVLYCIQSFCFSSIQQISHCLFALTKEWTFFIIKYFYCSFSSIKARKIRSLGKVLHLCRLRTNSFQIHVCRERECHHETKTIEYTILPFGFHIFLKMSRYVWYKRQKKFNLRLILQSVFWQKVVPLKSVHSTLWCETSRVIWTLCFWKDVSADLFFKVIFTIPWDQTIFHSPSFYWKDAGISKSFWK